VLLHLQANALGFIGPLQPQQKLHLAAHAQGKHPLVTGAM